MATNNTATPQHPSTVCLSLLLSGAENMARDGALLAQRKLAARVYTWDGPWVSLGISQTPQEALCNPEQTKWVQRPTGGGAVLHGHDVTVGLVMPLEGSVRHAYRAATAPLVEALNAIGVPAILAEDLQYERLRAKLPDCFASVSRNDIVDPVTLKKVCGCALRRTKHAVLVQASIPAGEPLVDPDSVIVGGVHTSGKQIDPGEIARVLEAILAR